MLLPAVLFLALCAFGRSDALANAGPTCDVGEQERIPGGLCSGGQGKCDDYCKRKFGAELLGAACSNRPGKNQGECICKLRCCNSGCYGDPHCWTCDGVRFGYQGLKKHYLLKPIKNYPTLPHFEISQINRVWGNGPMAILDLSEVSIADWRLVIQLKVPDAQNNQYRLKVNEVAQNIPYRFTVFDDYREHFVVIDYSNAAKTQVILTTSFGLRIKYTTNWAGSSIYADISIDTPRHPELKDNSHGLLGRWNGNPGDDAVDAKGVKQPLDDKFSWAFGDSWIVPGGRTQTPKCVREEDKQKNEQKFNEVDPKVKGQVEKMCQAALDNEELRGCAKKLGRVVPLIKNCVTDLIYSEPGDRKEYLADLVDTFLSRCKGKNIGQGDAVGLAV